MRIYIDYNAEGPDGRFYARSARLDGPVSLGEVVQTFDEDDNGVVMIVDEIDEGNGLVYLRPEWSTWVDGGSLARMTAPVRVAQGLVPFSPPESSLWLGAATALLSHVTFRALSDASVSPAWIRPTSSPA